MLARGEKPLLSVYAAAQSNEWRVSVDPRREGHAFGLDLTREISTSSAQQIAEAGKAWGQTDDITVVTVRRTSVSA